MLYCLLLYLTNSYYSIRYKFKENEAVELADFLQPMLNYDPDKRISAQELLKHKWLNMPANFEYTMNEKEYQKIVMIKQNSKKERHEDEAKVDVYESDNELNIACSEDNDEHVSCDDDNFENMTGGSEDEKDQIHINNFNNSFAAYGQYINLSACDRPNPQFNSFK